jgi:hypothetical protein
MDPIAPPLRKLARAEGKSPSFFYDLIDKGKIESVLIGNRRHVLLDSYRRYLASLVTEQAGAKLRSSNPKAKARQETVPAIAERSAAQQRRQAAAPPGRSSGTGRR